MIDGILRNQVLWAAAAGWIAAQTIKVIVHLLRYRKIDLRFYMSTGGMPSAHSALVSAAAWATGLLDGFESPVFAIAAIFAMIVMFDAQNIRWAASRQARILNQIVDELFQGHPISEERLKELLGHTPFQVFVGAAIGILVAYLIIR
ncbi:MAG: divergent PAP2 family protein [Anaerolineae bacterium]